MISAVSLILGTCWHCRSQPGAGLRGVWGGVGKKGWSRGRLV